jgi:hypothetical protein
MALVPQVALHLLYKLYTMFGLFDDVGIARAYKEAYDVAIENESETAEILFSATYSGPHILIIIAIG